MNRLRSQVSKARALQRIRSLLKRAEKGLTKRASVEDCEFALDDMAEATDRLQNLLSQTRSVADLISEKG